MQPENNPLQRTGLDYAREIMESSLVLFRECQHDSTHYEKVAPGVNGALTNLLAAEYNAEQARQQAEFAAQQAGQQ